MVTEALKRGAEVFKNVSCTGKTDIVLAKDDETIHVDVKMERYYDRSGSYCSPGKAGATMPRVLVNPNTWKVRWPKGEAPDGWKMFWD